MEIIIQGLVGMVDGFIHPNYVSSVAPLEGPKMVAIIAIVIGFTIFAIAIIHFDNWRTRHKVTILREDKPPPG